jgi:SAM-dependent methyltransferase
VLGWKDVSNYTFKIVTQFENVQLKWLLTWKNHEELSVLMKHYKDVSEHMKLKSPKLKEKFEIIENLDTNLVYSKELEINFIKGLEDWIVYVVDPNCYDSQEFNRWDTQELLSLTNFKGKTVIDIGSGTGSQVFRMAGLADTVFSVEPVGNLREYIKDKAKSLKFDNVYVVDGFMTELPYPNNFADIITSGHVFGDYMEDEYNEMHRVVKQGGMIILIPGNNDEDNDTHKFLISKGFKYKAFLEPGDGMKRKYWKIK